MLVVALPVVQDEMNKLLSGLKHPLFHLFSQANI